jgi:hypothetical protein
MTLQLENYGVSELSHSEQNDTDGGFLGIDDAAIALACAVIGAVWAVNEMSKDAQAGWNSYKPKNIKF